MDLVKLSHELLDEALVEGDHACLLGLRLPFSLMRQQGKFFQSDFVFESLTHDLSEEASNLDLHVFVNLSKLVTIDNMMLCNVVFVTHFIDCFVSCLLSFEFLLEQSAKIKEERDGWQLGLSL